MAKKTESKKTDNQNEEAKRIPTICDVDWTDYVLTLLQDDEKIKGNPTTDGLRRIFEIVMDCVIIDSTSEVCQSPDPDNGNRATVVHQLSYILNDSTLSQETKCRTVNGAADVYWGNCDKIFRNHPVAVAETRAEGRALRRALRLRKVVAAEEVVENIEDDIDGTNVGKITNNQINFIDVISQRLNVNVLKLLEANSLNKDNIYDIDHSSAVSIIRLLSQYQQNMDNISENILGYSKDWK
jgi:hypothetical protein